MTESLKNKVDAAKKLAATQIDAAITICEEVIAEDSEFLAAHVELAIYYGQKKSLHRSVDHAKIAVNLDPSSPYANYVYGRALLDQHFESTPPNNDLLVLSEKHLRTAIINATHAGWQADVVGTYGTCRGFISGALPEVERGLPSINEVMAMAKVTQRSSGNGCAAAIVAVLLCAGLAWWCNSA